MQIDAGVRQAVRAEPRRFSARNVVLALVLAVAGYGYLSGWFDSEPPAQPQVPDTVAPAPAQTQLEPTQPEATETVQAPPVAPPGASTEAPAEAAQEEVLPEAPVETPLAAPAVLKSDSGGDQPSVDVVRIESDGAAVIAGRAAPGAELILLDNGAPIGTVTADAFGEWVFIPADPLPSGAHDFGLVIKEVKGGASVPAVGQAPVEQGTAQDPEPPGGSGINEPGTVAGVAVTVPIPPRKPDTGTKQAVTAPSSAFTVQLASVKTRAGAQQEWHELRKRFPEILSELPLNLDEAKLSGGDTVVRLRTGGFVKQAEAAALCARLAAKHQDCLVVRTADR